MKRATRIFSLLTAGVFAPLSAGHSQVAAQVQPVLGARTAAIIEVDGHRFRDLDRNGKLTPYEDCRLPIETRVADLLSRMTLEEKAPFLMHPVYLKDDQVTKRHFASFDVRSNLRPRALAELLNKLQALSEQGRLGIPLTFSTDPKNQFSATFGTSMAASGFSQWPDPTGFGAIGDAKWYAASVQSPRKNIAR